LQPLSQQEFDDQIEQSQLELKQEVEPKLIEEVCHDIPLTECLFCDSVFESKELCFEYIHSHNFWIAYPSKINSIDSSLEYLYKKFVLDIDVFNVQNSLSYQSCKESYDLS
jgi:hypothetical protein